MIEPAASRVSELDERPVFQPQVLRKGVSPWLTASLWLLASVGYGLSLPANARWIVIIAWTALVAGIGVTIWRTSKRSQLALVGDQLIRRSAFARRVLFTVGAPGAVVEVTIKVSKNRSFPAWILLDQAGRAVDVALNRRAWGDAALDRVRTILGLEVEHIPQPVTLKEARQRWPGCMTVLRRT